MKKVDKTQEYQEYLNCIFFFNQDYSGFLASKSLILGDYPLVQIAYFSFHRCVCPHLLFTGV
ncbi:MULTISPECIES: hypothetical protein [unclassified Nostoc]|uniref:hypothetical protein n=1 Tax=unclassified Nostoc TaxID=2593658 RepID=UPI002AD27EB4|nr:MULTISPECIES: hypothetical protein [unclassified Nostoc]MDZ8120849.1 hypothetical protein [Nostoc sp. CmiVER01]MDZ8222260.1 hypothetical protein [Nostoc sp. ChiVER01]